MLSAAAKIERFEDLEVGRLARDLCRKICSDPELIDLKNETVLSRQIYKSSGSIVDNIAEGFERNGNREFAQFLSIAKGSCGEFRSQLYRAKDNCSVVESKFSELFNLSLEISKKLGSLLNYLSQSEYQGSKYYNRKA